MELSEEIRSVEYAFQDIMEDINFDFHNNEPKRSLKKDPEWVDFCTNCEEYKHEVSDFYDGDYQKMSNYVSIVYPVNNNEITEYKTDMIFMGYIKQKKNVKKSQPSVRSIFCESVLINKKNTKCNKNKCKLNHVFQDIPFCNANCKRITFDNNVYYGSCSKRHSLETFDNFLIRKNIKYINHTEFNIGFFSRPDSETVRKLLIASKHIGANNLTISIVNKKLTFDEFYDHIKFNSENTSETFDDDIEISKWW